MSAPPVYDYVRCARVFIRPDGTENLMHFTDLDGYGPLRFADPINIGDRVEFPFAGDMKLGNVLRIGKPFNGVQGIHAYVTLNADNEGSREYTAKLDEIRLTNAPPEGMLF